MLPAQVTGRRLHPVNVERCVYGADPVPQQGRGDPVVMDNVTVVSFCGSKTGVKRFIHRLRPLHPNISRQMCIGTPPPAIHGAF